VHEYGCHDDLLGYEDLYIRFIGSRVVGWVLRLVQNVMPRTGWSSKSGAAEA
jgi:hypothetical protein